MATKHVSDLSKSQEQVLLDLVNYANNTNIPLSALTITKISDNGRTARARLSSNEFSGFRGEQSVGYSQVDFDETLPVFVGSGKIIPVDGTQATVEDILNKALNINLEAEDLIINSGEQTLSFEPGVVNFFQITASEDSLIWDGEIEFEITRLTHEDVDSYRVRFAPTTVGMGVMPANTGFDESGAVMLTEDGKVIVGG